MHQSCNEITNFICRYGTFQFEVIPFRLNSGATLQIVMDKFSANVHKVKCYVDDEIVHSTTKEENVKHWRRSCHCYASMTVASGQANDSSCGEEYSCWVTLLADVLFIPIKIRNRR